jgi:hypothetical protein
MERIDMKTVVGNGKITKFRSGQLMIKNKYEGFCPACTKNVKAGEGELHNVFGKWRPFHSECIAETRDLSGFCNLDYTEWNSDFRQGY